MHQYSHDLSQPQPILCKFCEYVTTERNDLIGHHQEKHINHLPQYYKCDLCTFSHESRKILHEHSSDKHETQFTPFKCKICEKGYSVFYNFKIHLYEHEGKPKPKHMCDECGQEFRCMV